MPKIERSKKNYFAAGGIALLIAFSGVFAVISKMRTDARGHRPASVNPADAAKERTLSGANSFHLPVSGKSHGLVEIAIAAPSKGAVGKGTVIALEATVEARSDLDQLKFLWILPRDGVSLVEGPVEGDIGLLREGETTKLSLAIRSDTDENRRVHLHVYKLVNGEHMGKMAQYNTVNQEAIEWVAKDKAEKLERDAEARGSTVNKIYQ